MCRGKKVNTLSESEPTNSSPSMLLGEEDATGISANQIPTSLHNDDEILREEDLLLDDGMLKQRVATISELSTAVENSEKIIYEMSNEKMEITSDDLEEIMENFKNILAFPLPMPKKKFAKGILSKISNEERSPSETVKITDENQGNVESDTIAQNDTFSSIEKSRMIFDESDESLIDDFSTKLNDDVQADSQMMGRGKGHNDECEYVSTTKKPISTQSDNLLGSTVEMSRSPTESLFAATESSRSQPQHGSSLSTHSRELDFANESSTLLKRCKSESELRTMKHAVSHIAHDKYGDDAESNQECLA